MPALNVASDFGSAIPSTSPLQATQLKEESPSVASTNKSSHSTPSVGPSGLTCTLPSPPDRKLPVYSGPPDLGETLKANSAGFSSSYQTSRPSTLLTHLPSFRSGVLRIAPSIEALPSNRGRREIKHTVATTGSMTEVSESQPMPSHDPSPESPPPQGNIPISAYPAPDHTLPTVVFSLEESPPPDGVLEAAASSSRGGSPIADRTVSPTLSDVDRIASPHETEPVAELVRLTRDTYDKPRRVLVSPSVGVLSITMHGMVTLVDRELPRSVRQLCRSPFAVRVPI